jgi:hypothetical protein
MTCWYGCGLIVDGINGSKTPHVMCLRCILPNKFAASRAKIQFLGTKKMREAEVLPSSFFFPPENYSELLGKPTISLAQVQISNL